MEQTHMLLFLLLCAVQPLDILNKTSVRWLKTRGRLARDIGLWGTTWQWFLRVFFLPHISQNGCWLLQQPRNINGHRKKNQKAHKSQLPLAKGLAKGQASKTEHFHTVNTCSSKPSYPNHQTHLHAHQQGPNGKPILPPMPGSTQTRL